MKVALLTGGKDPHYVRGLLRELAARNVDVVVVGNEELADCHDPRGRVEVHNLIGSRDPDPTDGLAAKAWRVVGYYLRVLLFAARTDARLFHVLWFRKFPIVERTVLNGYFKLLRKKLVLTAHNVDERARNGTRPTLTDSLSLAFLYKTVDHIFVHTDKMKLELAEKFGVAERKVTVVPLGVNDAIPTANGSRTAARQRFGLNPDARVLLCFGQIAPYKGIEDLLHALAILVREDPSFTVVLAGRVKDGSSEPYWRGIELLIEELGLTDHVRKEIRYIPDDEVGLLFRASDIAVLPYRRVYQSGVLTLSYAQGVPVIAADVGSFRQHIVEGETGLVFKPGDVPDLVSKIRTFFAADGLADSESKRGRLREFAEAQFSWTSNVERTCAVYDRVLQG
jgi:D-inositol-3-phosphate glycosyltransferase